ncbi:SPOSA6832_03250, partial [Sporobolomyces salmonicolor]
MRDMDGTVGTRRPARQNDHKEKYQEAAALKQRRQRTNVKRHQERTAPSSRTFIVDPPLSPPSSDQTAKVATSTPTHPLELPPFSLHPLVQPVFPYTPTSRPTSPTKSGSPPPAARSRLGQLVSTVASGGAGAAGGNVEPKAVTVRSVEAGDQRVWVGGSDGTIKIYEVGEEYKEVPTGLLSPRGALSPTPSSPGSGGRRTPTAPREVRLLESLSYNPAHRSFAQANVLELMDEVVVTTNRKVADRIALLHRLDKAVVLSEGVMTFHSLPALTPLNVHQFPALRGIATFSLDEDELAGGGGPESMQICAIKRRSVHWLRITNEGITSIKDLPLPGGALISVLRRGRICIADAENYSIVDLEAAEALPLLPISQAPNLEPPPPSTSSASSGAQTPPAPGGPDPRQRPAIACVGTTEFLIASHTGSTTLGVFVNELGEPCRGTLEWASNLRSLGGFQSAASCRVVFLTPLFAAVVDSQYSIALLYNNTVEIHSIHTQEIVQVVTLPVSSSPFSFQPRSLVRSSSGLELGNATGANKVELISLRLLPQNHSQPPHTPTKRSSRTSISSLLTRDEKGKAKGTTTKTLVVGRNGLYALTPLTLVVQADALIDKGRLDDALALADNFAKSASEGAAQHPELAYVYLRAAHISLANTTFQTAFTLFLRSACDPRLIVRMFPDLRNPLIAPGDEVSVCRGLKAEVLDNKTIDDYVLDNLNRNYSPHIKPDVESASSTVELRTMLGATARDCLLSYLMKWRASRRGGADDLTANDSRKVDMVVDTTLVKLLAEQDRPDDIKVLLAGPNDCVLPQVEPALLQAKQYQLLSDILLARGETTKTLEIWSKCVHLVCLLRLELEANLVGVARRIVDGWYEDGTFSDGPRRIFDLVWRTKDKALVERYGLWMLKHDRTLGLKVCLSPPLFYDPKQTLTFDTREVFAKMREVDGEAADMFLEVAVLQERDTDSRLHADLVKRYIGRLGELLADSAAKAHLREQVGRLPGPDGNIAAPESAYTTLVSSSPSSPPSFLSFLTSHYDPNSPHAHLGRVRLKAILFLSGSSKYDVQGAKADLEEMEMKGLRGLTLERVIVYGKLRLDRQALALLLHTLHDLSSAESFALQSGDPLLPADVSWTASQLNLPFKRARKAKREDDDRRKESLARLLVEMCLKRPASSGSFEQEEDGKDTGRSEAVTWEQIARILETQAVHLDPVEVLPLLPDNYPLGLLSSFVARSLRRSLHARQEASLLKSLALCQNLVVSERMFELQAKLGGTVELGDETISGGGGGIGGVMVEKKEGEGQEREKGVRRSEEAVELDLR